MVAGASNASHTKSIGVNKNKNNNGGNKSHVGTTFGCGFLFRCAATSSTADSRFGVESSHATQFLLLCDLHKVT